MRDYYVKEKIISTNSVKERYRKLSPSDDPQDGGVGRGQGHGTADNKNRLTGTDSTRRRRRPHVQTTQAPRALAARKSEGDGARTAVKGLRGPGTCVHPIRRTQTARQNAVPMNGV